MRGAVDRADRAARRLYRFLARVPARGQSRDHPRGKRGAKGPRPRFEILQSATPPCGSQNANQQPAEWCTFACRHWCSSGCRSTAPAAGMLRVSALPTFAMRWLIPRLPEIQREQPRLELRILTASTPIEQFRMDVDAVISGPARQPGWVGKPFLREARLPVLSPELLRKCPLRAPADLERHTLLHAATLREASTLVRRR